MNGIERIASVSRLSRAAKEEMKKWKEKSGIRAIVPKTQNQKLGAKRLRLLARKMDRHERRKISLGPASEVRIIKSSGA
jgi:hypothetical protein